MKLLIKGKELKDDAAVQGLKDGAVITLFGTPEDKALKKIEATNKPAEVAKKEQSKVSRIIVRKSITDWRIWATLAISTQEYSCLAQFQNSESGSRRPS